MRKGISSLISVCFVMMISSLVILSACLVTFSSRFFRRQAERELSAAAENAASITKRYCNADHSREILHSHFTTGAEWTDAELILFDDTGKAVVTSEKGVFEQRSLSQYTIGLIGNRLVSFNTLDGFFDKACLSVIIRVDTDSRIYYVLSYLPPYGFDTFIRTMLMVCWLSAATERFTRVAIRESPGRRPQRISIRKGSMLPHFIRWALTRTTICG